MVVRSLALTTELALAATRGKIGEHLHEYTTYQVQLTMYSCKLPGEARPYPAAVADLRWVTSREFLDYDFPPADEKTMSKLLGLVRN